MQAQVGARPIFTASMAALIVLAWVALWSWGQSPYGRYLDHQYLDEVSRGGGVLLIVFVAGWTLMTVAMMLPTSLPLVAMFHVVTRQRQDGRRLVAILLLGYLSVWALFGLTVHAGDLLVHAIVAQVTWLQSHAWILGASTLILAGAYQFTPWKYVCLEKCRTPRSFIMQYWRGHNDQRNALRLGMHHGLFCVGCCWTLMLLMFTVGVGNFGWMLVLGAIMAMEKNLPWGRRISAPLGAILVTWGLVLAVSMHP
jgi:predicted metal-binding membrane protein